MITVNPDQIIFFQWRFVTINATLVFTWAVMGLLLLLAWLATRKLTSGYPLSRWQNLLETVVGYIRDQVREITQSPKDKLLPFSGALFLFISVSALLDFVPYYSAPTRSLSTTAALAITVFFAVPIYGIAELGVARYFKQYTRPSLVTLPFNIIGEVSRTLALAVRLFGNMMSGAMIVAVLLSIVPFFIPVVIQILGVIIGQIQAYVFAVLATVYISAGMRSERERVGK